MYFSLQQYLEFREELTLKYDVYEAFRKKHDAGSLLIIKEDKWTYLCQRWSYVKARTRVWQWKLDSNLPGRLGQIGDWLYRGEEMLDGELTFTDQQAENRDMVQQRLAAHKVNTVCPLINAPV